MTGAQNDSTAILTAMYGAGRALQLYPVENHPAGELHVVALCVLVQFPPVTGAAVAPQVEAPAKSIGEALQAEPCTAPSPEERQGEAITLMTDWSYVTISEGSNPPVHLVPAQAP